MPTQRARDRAVRVFNAYWFALCRAWVRFGRAGLAVGLVVYVAVLLLVGLVMGGAALWTVVTTRGADRPWP